MKKKIRGILNKKSGFTLVEMIMVISVIAVLSTITFVGIYGYMKSAYSLKANQTAKTVFYAAQNYLVDQKQKGALDEFNKQAEKEDAGGEIEFDTVVKMLEANGKNEDDINEFKTNHESGSKFRYIYINDVKSGNAAVAQREQEDNKEDNYNVLYTEILEPYIKDQDVTDHSFLIEYDSTTGVVMSVFYSEKIDGFVTGSKDLYDISEEKIKNRDNVIKRGKEALSDKWQGYYGIYETNLSSASVELNEPEVCLINGERLILKWKDTNVKNHNPAFVENPDLKEKLYFEVAIGSANRGDKVISLLKIPKIQASTSTPKTWADEAALIDKNKKGNPVFISYVDETGDTTYELLLDCIHYPILDNYKEVLASDMLQCTVTAKLEGMTTTEGSKKSNLESANYGGGVKEVTYDGKSVDVGGSGNTSENGVRSKEILSFAVTDDLSYTVKNARHFNNIRNVTANKDFLQTGDIDWQKVEGKANSKVFETFLFAKEESKKLVYKVDTTFTGTYRVVDNKYTVKGLKIKDTAIDKGSNVGVFSINAGSISGIKIKNSDVTGIMNVGGLVGQNAKAGKIENVSIEAEVSGAFPQNSESVAEDIKNKLGSNIGGVVGLNKGAIKNVATESKTVTGRKHVGGVIGYNESSDAVVKATNENGIHVLTSEKAGWENFGGIAGSNAKGATLRDCENNGLIQVNELDNYTKEKQPMYIGGIVGYNEGTISTCTNKNEKVDIEEKSEEYIDALKADATLPEFYGIFVGGIAGANVKGSIDTCSVQDAYITGSSLVGGVTGANWNGTLLANQGLTTADISGLIIGSGNLIGGVAGYTDGSLQNFENSADIFGSTMVGGVTGFHGSMFNSMDELEQYDWNKYFDGLVEGTEEYYNAIFTVADSSIVNKNSQKLIENCKNKGFVYASTRYSGGIAGVNWGTINNSYCNMDSAKTTNLYEEEALRRADCAGGIAGLNNGTITTTHVASTESVVYGKSFVGGVVGCNLSTIQGYDTVIGSAFGSGNYVGGFLGLNNNAQIVGSTLKKEGNGKVTGRNYVAGLIGCNILNESDLTGSTVKISASTSDGTSIIGEAYIGGILGYHVTLESGETLANVCPELYGRDPYVAFDMTTTNPVTSVKPGTEMTNCDNAASVEGFRYVGGIVGFVEESSKLTVINTRNYGSLSIAKERMSVSGIVVKDDIVSSTEEQGTSYFIGGITGRNTVKGTIQSCFNRGSVSSPSRYLGGLCEINEGLITNCTIGDLQSYDTNVSGDNSVGGIVGLNRSIAGSNQSGLVSECKANTRVTVIGGTNTGGLVGTNRGSVEKCQSYASVRSKGNNVGGIVGINYASMDNNTVGSSATKPFISGNQNVGGFVGSNQGTGGVISDLRNYADVSGVHQVGGIVGIHNAKRIESCFNYGEITATGVGEVGCAGGITGINASENLITLSENHGTVISKKSKAGGITGWNKGTISKSTNQGSVQGAYDGNGVDAVGGITGTNERKAKVENCKSIRNAAGTNSINGAAMVGGIVGQNAGIVSSTKKEDYEVTIPIKITQNLITAPQNKESYIGGIIGRDGTGKGSRDQQTLAGFIYSGIIDVAPGGSRYQYIGGIIGSVEKDYTVDGCEFTGTITGAGNTGYINPSGYLMYEGGVGGIAGLCSGRINLSSITNDNKRFAVSSNASEKRLHIVVEGNINVGGIVGFVKDTASVVQGKFNNEKHNQITNYGTVNGTKYIGGIFGRITANISYSHLYNQGTVSGNNTVGGVIGSQTQPSATLSDSKNEISGRVMAVVDNKGAATIFGGITGDSQFTITDCHNEGTLEVETNKRKFQNISNVGGIQGQAGQGKDKPKISIRNCTNSGKILLGNQQVGGILGRGTGVELVNCVNGETGEVNAPSASQGGIVGYITSASNKFENCRNDGRVIVENFEYTGTKEMQVGGIVGNILENNSSVTQIFKECENRGRVISSFTQSFADKSLSIISLGGIIGTSAARIELYDNKNSGLVDNTSAASSIRMNDNNAGGIIGQMKMPFKTPIDNNIYINISGNKNTLSGIVRAFSNCGGIVGRPEGFLQTAFTDNWNEGMVEGQRLTGGLIGNIYRVTNAKGLGEISGGGNKGVVKVSQILENPNSKESSMAIGGCIGVNSGSSGFAVVNLVNRGKIEVDSRINQISYIGGIVGNSNGFRIEECTNEVSIDLSKHSVSITGIGGIVGYGTIGSPNDTGVSQVTTIKNCENKSSILTPNADQVGGIAGVLDKNSVVIASRNTNENQTIRGKRNVGGIVGETQGINAKIMGEVTLEGELKGTNPTYNEQNIIGSDAVGGIVGWQEFAMLYSVYNSGDVQVLNSLSAAGGLVGVSKRAGGTGDNSGLLINCYNIGNVGYSKENNSSSVGEVTGYIGGLVGFRECESDYINRLTIAISKKKRCNSTVIKDCYYIAKNIEQTLPAKKVDSQPVTSGKWAVGNEPFAKFDINNGDSQISKEENGRFQWNEDAFNNLLDEIKPKDEYQWDDKKPKANINVMLNNYVYKLPVPMGKPVTGVEGHTYNMKWDSQVGLNSGLYVYLYADANLKEKLYEMPVTEQTTEGVNIVIPDDVATKYMGKTLYIATAAKGYKIDDIPITYDSDLAVVQHFVMMPPLPKPKVETILVPGTMKVTIKVTNIQAFMNQPKADYPILGDLEIGDMYSKYEKGAHHIVIEDYYGNKEGEMVSYKKRTIEIPLMPKDFEKDTVEYTIDYEHPDNNIDGRLFHTYQVQSAISPEMSEMSLRLGDPTFAYRYLSSFKAEGRVEIKTTSNLLQPKELNFVYTGDTKETSYTLSWKNPDENKKKTSGYEITVINIATKKKVVKQVIGENTTTCELTKEELQELITDFSYDSMEGQLSFTVKALTGAENIKDSIMSAPCELNVPLKQATPKDLEMKVLDPIFTPNIVEFNWVDEDELDTDYFIEVFVNGVPMAESSEENVLLTGNPTKGNACRLKIDDNLLVNANVNLEIRVTKTGNKGFSLDSENGIGTFIAYKRLPQIISGEAEREVSTDPTKIDYTVRWSIPEGVNEDNSVGYVISLVDINDLEMTRPESSFVYDVNATKSAISFDITNLGQSALIYIAAIGKDGVSSTSRQVQLAEIMLPTDRVESSKDLKVQLTDKLGAPVGETCSEETLRGIIYKLSWVNPEVAFLLNGHRIMLTDNEGKIISLGGKEATGDDRFIEITEAIAHNIEIDLGEYQGQTLIWSIINKPNASNLYVSVPTTVEFKVPTVIIVE